MAPHAQRLRAAFQEHRSGQSADSPLPFANRESDLLTLLPLEQITPDPHQPRKDLGDLSDLMASIQQVGILQPVLVTRLAEDHFQLLAGERRYAAARALGLLKIPAIVRTLDEHKRLEVQLIENVQRKDLNPLEEAQGYRRLMEEFGLTQEQVAQRVGKSRVAINQTLRLLDLSEEIKEECRRGESASRSLLLEIAKQSSEAEQQILWKRAKQGQLTVQQAREKKALTRGKGRKASPCVSFRYPISTEIALVTVEFADRSQATFEEIVEALEQALAGERERVNG